MKLRKNLHWLIYVMFVASCAKQSAPTGGPKDSIPPILSYSIPAKEAINFKGKTIELAFSELIILNNPKEQIIITPTVGKNYEIKHKKNKVTLTLENDLKDSTTYSFNFRDAVQDITEKNPAKNLQIAFSTGPYIDSLSIEGTVRDLLSQKELKDVTVALQNKNDTFSILKHTPVYFTKTDDKGKYRISNLKPDIYELYAIEDLNKNLIADTRNESYGFLKDSIDLKKDLSNIYIDLIKLDTRQLKLTSARSYNTYFNIKSSKSLKHARITAADSLPLYYTFSQDRSSIQLYNTRNTIDSLQINVVLSDSIQNRVDTTMFAKFNKNEVTPEQFQVQTKDASILLDKKIMKIVLAFTKPLKEINFDSISFSPDSLTTIKFSSEHYTYDTLNRILTIEKNLRDELKQPDETLAEPEEQPDPRAKSKQKGSRNYLLRFGNAAFISAEQDSSRRTTTTEIKRFTTQDLGIILSEVRTSGNKFIVELVDKDLNVIQSFRNKSKAAFEDLQPGEYLLRIILDTNDNGTWDPGNYLKKEEPEKIKYYQNEKGVKSINLKANFELGPLLITY